MNYKHSRHTHKGPYTLWWVTANAKLAWTELMKEMSVRFNLHPRFDMGHNCYLASVSWFEIFCCFYFIWRSRIFYWMLPGFSYQPHFLVCHCRNVTTYIPFKSPMQCMWGLIYLSLTLISTVWIHLARVGIDWWLFQDQTCALANWAKKTPQVWENPHTFHWVDWVKAVS